MNDMIKYTNALVEFGKLFYAAFKINMTQNAFELIYTIDGYDNSFLDECDSLEDVLAFPVKRGIVHPDDVDDYNRCLSLDYLKKYYALENRQDEYRFKYRSIYNHERYHVVEVMLIPDEDYRDDNQTGYAFIKDMGGPFADGRMLFEEILRGLAEDFESIHYVNFDENRVYPYRMNDYIRKKQGEELLNLPSYEQAIENYIKDTVLERDREAMREFCSRKNIERLLANKRAASHEFRVFRDGKETYFRVKFANMDGAGELHHCVVGFANINSEMHLRREYNHVGKKILIVEDDPSNREILKEILDNRYEILETSDGIEAISLLEKNYKDIALVLSDLFMPNCNGFELLERMSYDKRLADIPVMITTAYGDDENKIKCLELGAADFVSKPFNRKVIVNRIESLVRLRGLVAMIDTIETDRITGLYTKEAFYRYAQDVIDFHQEQEYMIIVSDIIGFKAINEQYGKEMGDKVLKYVASIAPQLNDAMIIGGRLGADTFACLIPAEKTGDESDNTIPEMIQKNAPIPNLFVKFGFYNTKNGRDLSVQRMCDRAGLALSSIKQTYGRYVKLYDESMRQKLMMEQNIIDGMEKALTEEQFSVYFQPKHDIQNGYMNGAEALVRWIHPELGFMNPGLFIPLFERNGFINKLDKYIWEKVCQEIAYWSKEGIEFPISVNVSRADFVDDGLADYIVNLANKYHIKHELLHIEVTESAYSDNPDMIKDTIKELHDARFIIELDDFGTGYSSITALSSLDIDILKLDMSIIRNDKIGNEKSVLEFSVQLAKMMNLKITQEGVETEEQLSRVKDLGCDYVQGYYYSKPLPQIEFAEYVRANNGN